MALLLDEGTAIFLVVGSSASLLNATLFGLIVGPFLGGWRQSMEDDQPWLYAAISALLCGGLLLWTLFTLPALFLAAIYVVGADIGAQPWTDLLPALDYVVDGVGGKVLVVAWLSGVAGAFVCRQQRLRHRCSVPESPLWRKLLGALLFTPYVLALLTIGDIVSSGLRLDPELRAVYSEEIARELERKAGKPEEMLLKAAPSSFSQAAVVAEWGKSSSSSAELWNQVLEVWCREASKLWVGEAFWKNPQLVAMAELVASHGIVERDDLRASLRSEAIVRSAVVLLDRGGMGPTQSQRLFELELPQQGWQNLLEIALARHDLLQGAELTDDDVRHKFLDGAARVLAKGDYNMDGRLQRRFFQRAQERSELNHLWRSYQEGKPYPAPEEPLGREPFEARYASSIEFDLKAIDHDIFQVTFSKELARQNLAYDIVLMELKRLELGKTKLPHRWDQFRPEVGQVGRAYDDWMSLTPTADGVHLQRRDPWLKMSLLHRFTDT